MTTNYYEVTPIFYKVGDLKHESCKSPNWKLIGSIFTGHQRPSSSSVQSLSTKYIVILQLNFK